jgi:hypothetical protein
MRTITTEHVDLISSKPFEKTVKDLTAELGKASTEKLMDRLSASDSWDAYAAECADFAGRSNLIEVGYLNWGKVLTLSGKAMKARCYIVGNPLTAQKLLAAGGPAVGLYLPTSFSCSRMATGRFMSLTTSLCRSWPRSAFPILIKSPERSMGCSRNWQQQR